MTKLVKKDDKGYIMIENKIKTLEFKVTGEINLNEVEIMIDTGESCNFIAKKLVEQIGLVESEGKPMEVLTVNGECMSIKSKTSVILKLHGFKKEFSGEVYFLKIVSKK